MKKINLKEACTQIDQYWDPHIVGDVNDSQIKVAKIKGAFDWHKHETEDEAFLVIRGGFEMELRDGSYTLAEGDMFVVPRGVEHRPVAEEECWIMLVEPATTLNTGNVVSDKTKQDLKRL